MTEALIVIGSFLLTAIVIFAGLYISGNMPKKKLHEVIVANGGNFDFRFFIHTSRTYRIFFRYKIEYEFDTNLSPDDETCFGVTVDAALILPGKPDTPVKRGFGDLLPEGVPRYSGGSLFYKFENSFGGCSKSATVVLCIIKKARIGEINFKGAITQSGNIKSGRYSIYIC